MMGVDTEMKKTFCLRILYFVVILLSGVRAIPCSVSKSGFLILTFSTSLAMNLEHMDWDSLKPGPALNHIEYQTHIHRKTQPQEHKRSDVWCFCINFQKKIENFPIHDISNIFNWSHADIVQNFTIIIMQQEEKFCVIYKLILWHSSTCFVDLVDSWILHCFGVGLLLDLLLSPEAEHKPWTTENEGHTRGLVWSTAVYQHKATVIFWVNFTITRTDPFLSGKHLDHGHICRLENPFR